MSQVTLNKVVKKYDETLAVRGIDLDIFDKERLLANLPPKIAFMGERLQQMKSMSHVGDVRQAGMIGAIELVKNKDTGEPFAWEERIGVRVCLEARKHGLFLRPLGNVIVIFPPLAISLDELRLLMDGIAASIQTVTGCDIFREAGIS